MSAAAGMAIVLFVFFLVGVTVGIIVVIAMSARKADRTARRAHRAIAPGDTWPYLRQAGPDNDESANLRDSGVPEYGRLGPMDVPSGQSTLFSEDTGQPMNYQR